MLANSFWTFARQPLLLLFSMGFTLSLASSDRLSLRTTADGMISFAFLVVAQLAAIGFLYLRSDRRMPFARVVDSWFASNRPWFIWMLAFVVWETVTRGMGSLDALKVIVATFVVPLIWAACIDLQFIRALLGRQSVAVDLIAARAISWTIALGYFFGIAAWAQIVAWLR